MDSKPNYDYYLVILIFQLLTKYKIQPFHKTKYITISDILWTIEMIQPIAMAHNTSEVYKQDEQKHYPIIGRRESFLHNSLNLLSH